MSGLVFTIARNYRNDLARRAQHEMLGCETRVKRDCVSALADFCDERILV